MYTLIGDSGTVTFDKSGTVTSEGVKLSSKVTSNPIEGGGNINDHAAADPVKFDIAGIVPDATGRDTLEAMQRNCDLISYRGVEAYDNLVITSLSFSRAADNDGGYSFTASFQQVQIASAAFVPISGPKMTQQDKSKRSSTGKAKTNNGTVPLAGDYSDYVSSFNTSNTNKTITQARSNPGDAGYGNGR